MVLSSIIEQDLPEPVQRAEPEGRREGEPVQDRRADEKEGEPEVLTQIVVPVQNQRADEKESEWKEDKKHEKLEDSTKDENPARANDGWDIHCRYKLGECLGTGTFAQVYQAHQKQDPSQVVAIKIINAELAEDKKGTACSALRNEIEILQQIRHENIIIFLDSFEIDKFPCAVMELCCGGCVFDRIVELVHFTEHDSAFFGYQMLAAIDYIHGLHIVHRDVKAENFMLKDQSVAWPQIKMVDFGTSTKFQGKKPLTECCGSAHYMAPELLGGRYNSQVDMWSFGVLMYLMLYGRYPFRGRQARDIMVLIVTAPIKFPTKVAVSEECLSFLKRLLDRNPQQRLSAFEALEDPWMVGECSEADRLDDEDEAAMSEEIAPCAILTWPSRSKSKDSRIDGSQSLNGLRIFPRSNRGQTYGGRQENVRRANRLQSAPSRFTQPTATEIIAVLPGAAAAVSSRSSDRT